MQRITISIDEPLADALDAMAEARAYTSRSEAMRDLVRDGLERWRADHVEAAHCVAILSYVFDRRIRSLPQRLADMQHAAHDLVVSTTAVRLDHDNTLETVILRGSAQAVRHFADHVQAERGVRLSSLKMVQVEPGDAHEHPGDHHHHGHLHLTPRS
ncbi:nickel responsive regulator [Novosphingobium nitrogenifigens DSM 19370]|uniref:Putative nickel-responsive regulator n=1 Tax=Novosphingobium nitrogenifigens DSM 19370 TaxID=983920 RepID=F1Z384_9SPHN|nr:nickel-responsive transcriptional regulator NikR [Novosphingobium nitrogenifigens]EGD60929.1 nickel responsive regulator [Novosphingobium nitrogenifigens DSM 19370]